MPPDSASVMLIKCYPQKRHIEILLDRLDEQAWARVLGLYSFRVVDTLNPKPLNPKP